MRFPSFSRISPLSAAVLFALAAGCGGTTAFAGANAINVAGTPPPPPPPAAPKPVEAAPVKHVELRNNKIEIDEKIQFEVAKAVIKPESFGLLKEIANEIKANPQIKKLSIEGHASAEGDDKNNLKLSDDRAKSVMKYLVEKEGVAAGVLAAKGFGEAKPIADNATPDGKEKNRRVEFVVLEQDVTTKKVEVDKKTGAEKVIEEKKATEKAAAPATDKAAKPDVKLINKTLGGAKK